MLITNVCLSVSVLITNIFAPTVLGSTTEVGSHCTWPSLLFSVDLQVSACTNHSSFFTVYFFFFKKMYMYLPWSHFHKCCGNKSCILYPHSTSGWYIGIGMSIWLSIRLNHHNYLGSKQIDWLQVWCVALYGWSLCCKQFWVLSAINSLFEWGIPSTTTCNF